VRDEQSFNFSPQNVAARLVHAYVGLLISSQVMSKVHPLDHQEDQPIYLDIQSLVLSIFI
jgi:citrate lyase gamma subunit